MSTGGKDPKSEAVTDRWAAEPGGTEAGSSEDLGDSTTFHSGPHTLPTLADGASLPVIDLKATSAGAEFELGETLGTGGMGQVVSAKQKALQRSVAIKFLKHEGDDSTLLLREAIATGRLEHPNIVPIHVLAKTPAGVPFFTMKRVEGTPWSDALKGKRSLVEHLEILQRVCDAIAFAHDRGVIHRDVKPANVLIGAFGEVYLVDWGLAASMVPDSVLPRASEAGLAGTPGYFAPEMARPDGKLGPWTDVFLLGATLYEVLMGRPPWSGASIEETIAVATSGKEPALDSMVPTELANICRRAMKRDPAERFESAKAFKEAITGYLRHHEAYELHERTVEKLDELERALRGEASAVPVERLFTECRFGFEQVRRAWPDFEPARVSLRKTLVSMVRYELSRNAPQSARALLSEIVQPPTELVMQVEDAERAEKQKAARLITLEHQVKEASTEAVRGPKAVYTKGLAIASVVASFGAQAVPRLGLYEYTTRDGLFFSLALVLNGLMYDRWLKNQPEANALQRRMSFALIGLAVLSGLGWTVALLNGVGFAAAMIMYFVINATGWWTASIAIEKRGAIVSGGFAVAAVLGTLFPAYVTASGASIGVSLWLLSRALRDSTVARFE